MSEAAVGDNSLNDQVRDSVDQLQATLAGLQQPFASAAAFHTISHALGLALHNAVARQQHSHMLRNALTTAAAMALLNGQDERAQAVLKLAESPLVNPTFDAEIGPLQAVVKNLREELEKTLAAAAGAKPASPGATG